MPIGKIPQRIIEYCSQNVPETNMKQIDIKNLKDYGTSCGDVPNSPFTKTVISFLLKNSDVSFVLVEIDTMNFKGKEGERSILNMAVKWKEKNREHLSERFAEMINTNGGSLRPELIFEENWDCYESE